MATKKVQENGTEAPLHGDMLEAIFSHVPLIYLVQAIHVSKSWKRAVLSSLRHVNPMKPWLTIHTQNPRAPHVTKSYAYDPRSKTWIEFHAPETKHSTALRSSHSNFLYTLSPTEFSFSLDPLNLKWHHAQSPRVWRIDPIVVRVRNQIIVAGGACNFEEDPLAVEMYNMESRTWVNCQSMPEMMKDSSASTWLSVAVTGDMMHVTEKYSGTTYSFDSITMMWQGPYELLPEENVFMFVTVTVRNRLLVAGIVGEGVKLWEVKGELGFGMKELGEVPKEMVVKLKGESETGIVNSIGVISIGDYVYIYNPSEPEEMVVCEILKGGGCKWEGVTNVVVNDVTRMGRIVFCGGDVEFEDLKQVLSLRVEIVELKLAR